MCCLSRIWQCGDRWIQSNDRIVIIREISKKCEEKFCSMVFRPPRNSYEVTRYSARGSTGEASVIPPGIYSKISTIHWVKQQYSFNPTATLGIAIISGKLMYWKFTLYAAECTISSLFISIYLSIYLSIYGSTALLFDLGRFFSFLILCTVSRTPWTGDQPVAKCYLHTQNANKK
jgi:hypothetical protein